MKIRLLYDWESETGEKYEKGTFLEVDDQVGKELIGNEVAEAKTPEEYEFEQEAIRREDRRRQQEKRRFEARGQIARVHERVKDDPRGGFKYLGEFAQDVAFASKRNGNISDKLSRWQSHCKTDVVEYDDSQGGYLVPMEYSTQILKTQLEASIVRPRAQFVPMQTNRIGFPAVVDADHSTSLFGGINIQRPGEAAAKTKDKPTFRQIELTLHKLTGLVAVSDEMLEDSPVSMEPLLTDLFGQTIAFVEDDDFINGTGINMALGVRRAPALVTVAKETGQPADTIEYANIVKMWARCFPRSQGNAVWLANNDCFPQISTMGLPVGTGGGPAYLPANGLSGSPYGTLMGRPLILTEKCQTVGDLGDILLVDWSQYLIGGKPGAQTPKVAQSTHLYFNYDETAFRFVLRYDGQPWWTSALTPLYSALTLSPFVALAERA